MLIAIEEVTDMVNPSNQKTDVGVFIVFGRRLYVVINAFVFLYCYN